MHKWYVLQVLSSQEKKVQRNLEENKDSQGMASFVEEVLLPVENVLEVKAGEQKVQEKRLWPGYLLIKMILNDDSWMYVKNTNGVIDFLGGGNPNPLTDHEVEQILSELAAKIGTVTQKQSFNVGDRVKIVDGVFVNFVGTVTEIHQDKGVVSVLVSIFDRDTPVNDLEFWQVEEVTEGDEEVG